MEHCAGENYENTVELDSDKFKSGVEWAALIHEECLDVYSQIPSDDSLTVDRMMDTGLKELTFVVPSLNRFSVFISYEINLRHPSDISLPAQVRSPTGRPSVEPENRAAQ